VTDTPTDTPTETPTVIVTSTDTVTPTETVTLPVTYSPTSTPTLTTTVTPTDTPTSTSTPLATATPTLTPSVISQSIVFVSRAIPVNGSRFYSPTGGTNSYPEVGAYSRFESAGPGKLQIMRVDGSIQTLFDGSTPDSVYGLVDFNAPDVSYDASKIV